MSPHPTRNFSIAVLVLFVVSVSPAASASMTAVYSINNRGQILGSGPATNGERHLLLWSHGTTLDLGVSSPRPPLLGNQGEVAFTDSCDDLRARPARWIRGDVTVFGSCQLATIMVAINARGDILWGNYNFDKGIHSTYVWSHDTNTLVGDPDKTELGSAMNDAGDVLVWSDVSHPFIWSSNGKATPLDSLAQWSLLNNRDQTVGSYQGSGRIVLWDHGTVIELKPLPGGTSRVNDLNDGGIAVGTCTVSDVNHAVLWESGSPRDLGTLPGDDSSAAGFITNGGAVLGTSFGPEGLHAFLWKAGSMVALGSLGGNYTTVKGVNEQGQVIGNSRTSSGEFHPYLWDHGTMTDLSVDPSDARLPAATVGPVSASATPASTFGFSATPSPALGPTTLEFTAPQGTSCGIDIFDVEGRVVRRLDAGVATGSPESFVWDDRDQEGRNVRAGIYWARLTGGGMQWGHKVVLARRGGR